MSDTLTLARNGVRGDEKANKQKLKEAVNDRFVVSVADDAA
jgi:hypothetical protein